MARNQQTADPLHPGAFGLTWSAWYRADDAFRYAPALPGIYMARYQGQLVYVGMAGPRNGKGLSGRLRAYAVGKAPDGGLPYHASKLALQDPRFCDMIATAARRGQPWDIRQIAVQAMGWLSVELRCAAAPDPRAFEARVIAWVGLDRLWNSSH